MGGVEVRLDGVQLDAGFLLIDRTGGGRPWLTKRAADIPGRLAFDDGGKRVEAGDDGEGLSRGIQTNTTGDELLRNDGAAIPQISRWSRHDDEARRAVSGGEGLNGDAVRDEVR